VTKPDGIIHLHGRSYKTVALRVQEFRDKCPISEGWALITAMVHCDDVRVVFRAAVVHPSGKEIACGFAEEKRSPKGINSTSALENAETSAIGRALAAAGFGGTEYASADELVNALNQQRENEREESEERAGPHPSWRQDWERFTADLKKRGLLLADVSAYCLKRGWGRPSSWTTEERTRFLVDLDGGDAFPELQRRMRKPEEVAGG
jgi:hypothetical protein